MFSDNFNYVHNHPEFYFTQKAKNGGYICPVCGNGSGKDGTGVKLIKGQSFRFKCFKCGTSGDVINFYAVEHRISNAEAIPRVFTLYGLQQPHHEPPTPIKNDFKIEDIANDLQVSNFIADDIDTASEQLHLTDYFSRRGISMEIAKRFNCGFIKNWIHPKKRNDNNVIPSDRVIIPTSPDSYVARATNPDNKLPKMKAGNSNIFNIDILKSSNQHVVIVEGEFDALSVIEAGNDSIALGSTTNVDNLIHWLKDNNIKPNKPLIIDLDNDNAGVAASNKLADGLRSLHIRFFHLSLILPDCKDQNESLVKKRQDFINKVRKISSTIEELKKNARKSLSDSAKVPQWEFDIAHANDAIPTGWKTLDNALDGGLYEGLYVIPGSTGTGKTAFALQMAYQIAKQKKDVLYISLEMGELEIYQRHISRISYDLFGDSSRAKSVHSIIKEKRTVDNAKLQFQSVSEYLRTICGVGSIDADDIRKIVETYEYELDSLPVVFVDYLQILKAHDPHMTDKQAVDYNVLRLKQLSRDYKIPIIALASMNRTSYSDVISMVSIKESGAIEYTSDVCIGLQMAAMDKIVDNSKRQGQQEKQVRQLKAEKLRKMQAVILKHRNGAIGAEIPLTYYAMFHHFKDEELQKSYFQNPKTAKNL